MASWSREAGDIVLVKTGRPHRPLANGAQGCVRHRWVEPRGRNERERVSQIVRELRACPWRSRWPITRRPGRSWERERAAQREPPSRRRNQRSDPVPCPDFRLPISEFQPFPCRPAGDGSGEKLQALLSQREVMLQLPLHSRPQILRWTCACKVPRIFPPGFDQA